MHKFCQVIVEHELDIHVNSHDCIYLLPPDKMNRHKESEVKFDKC